MKKIFTYSILAVLMAILFTSCRKEKVQDNNSYWLSQERGTVVYKSNYCGIFVLETAYGFTIIQSHDGLRVYTGDLLYGNFGGMGTRDFYNYSTGAVTRGEVLEYDLSYYQAQDAIDFYCPYGKAAGSMIIESVKPKAKIARPGGL